MRPSDDLFDISNPGSEETYGVTDGPDVIFEICESPYEWSQHVSELFELSIV